MQYGCIGEKLGHSFSKLIHESLTDYTYELCELSPDEVADFLRKREFKAINVTIPYKQTVMEYLDKIDTVAQSIGAVNTIVNRDGKLYGYNTDFFGMKSLIERENITLTGKKVLILGSGGTSKTAVAVAQHLGAAIVCRVSRTAKEDSIDYQRAKIEYADADIIINTTPVGMFPNIFGAAVDMSDFPKAVVVDAVYNPLRSSLVLEARHGVGGLYMLVAQAAKAVEYFLSCTVPLSQTERVYRELLLQKENIVLIGMPSCGKSTVGRILADRLGRALIDTDALIAKKAGCSIPEIFEKQGESAFRDMESEVIAQIAAQQGSIISVGGGAILRAQNVQNLRRNGRLCFIDRPLDELTATADRPLSSDREMMEKRYRERYDIYCAAADIRVWTAGGPEAVVEMIIKER